MIRNARLHFEFCDVNKSLPLVHVKEHVTFDNVTRERHSCSKWKLAESLKAKRRYKYLNSDYFPFRI